MTLFGLFAGIAVTLAVIGTYGVISSSVTQRIHEIGVRMALGAEREEVLRLIIMQGMGLALVGVRVGLVGALCLSRFMAGLLSGVKPTDPARLAAVSLIVAALALVASLPPRSPSDEGRPNGGSPV